jgi:ribosomal subunit interface protein
MTYVEEQVAKLEKFHSRLTGCHVIIRAPSLHHHRKGNPFEVCIELSAPKELIVVTHAPSPQEKTNEDVYAALRKAFTRVRRRLEDHVRHLTRDHHGVWSPS